MKLSESLMKVSVVIVCVSDESPIIKLFSISLGVEKKNNNTPHFYITFIVLYLIII